MAERPALTYEAFLTLARQQGFEMDDPHLRELFPEALAMYQRIELLDKVDTYGVQPEPGLTDKNAVALE